MPARLAETVPLIPSEAISKVPRTSFASITSSNGFLSASNSGNATNLYSAHTIKCSLVKLSL